MSKFKVGNRVRRVLPGTIAAPIGYETRVEAVDKEYFSFLDKEGCVDISAQDNWELVQPASAPSPVITKTVKEIVPGEFGGVVIEEHVKTVVHLHMLRNTFDKHELREAARIFNELADALDDQ